MSTLSPANAPSKLPKVRLELSIHRTAFAAARDDPEEQIGLLAAHRQIAERDREVRFAHPHGPRNTTFSARSAKARLASSMICLRGAPVAKPKSYWSRVLIAGKMAALATEAADYVERHRDERNSEGRALVVHNGRAKARKLKRRGMVAPVVAVGDGALGFWAAAREVWPRDPRAGLLVPQACQRARQAAGSVLHRRLTRPILKVET